MFGNNIKLNFQQSKLYDERAIRYIDADGSIDTLCQSIGSGNPVHYSVDNSLTFYSSDNALYINGKTKLLFDGNKSYRFYDASFVHQEKLMYDIIYSGTKITRIDGYTDGLRTHYVTFTYSGDFVISAQSYIATSLGSTSFQNLATCTFTYDEDGNLIQIKNSNSGNNKYTLEYYNGELYGVTDFDGNGYLFGRTHWTSSSPMRMSIINYIYGTSPAYDEHYSNDYVYFGGDETTSTVTYYATGGTRIGEKKVSRRFTQGTRSEWYEDADGEITITSATSNMTGETSQESVTYTQNIYSTIEKQNTSLSGDSYNSISPGSSITGSILSNHGIVSKTGRQYAVSMLIETYGTAFIEVLIGGTSRAKLSLNGKNNSYFIIPTSYHSTSSTTSIQIKNVGSNYVYISNVSYNYYTSTKITKQMQTMSVQNYVSSIENRGLDYKQTTNYDFLGQATNATEIDYTGSSAVTKNYTYSYEPYPNISPASEFDIQRLMSISNGTDEVSYSYVGNVTTVTVKKDGTNVSQVVTETGGALGSHYTISTENGITTRIDYAIKGGNVRPYKYTSGTSIIEYDYNYDGEVTLVKEGTDLTQQTGYSSGKEISYTNGGSDKYTLTRDASKFGLVTSINHNGSQRLAIDYTEYGDIVSKTYANGATENYIYDYRDLQSIELRDSASATPTIISYGYTNGDLTSITQSLNGYTQLSYQFSDSKTQYVTSVSGAVNAGYTYNYDEDKGVLTSRIINLENGGRTRTENFVYDNHGVLQENGNSTFKTQYTYDNFDRLATKKQVINGTVKQNIQYGYVNTADYQSGRISSIYNTSTGYTQTYGYNTNGYVSRYVNPQNGDNYTYSYDNAGRLISDGTYTYTYDTLNNITKKTSGSTTYEYTYWSGSKTRIKSIIKNGVESANCTYDGLGNIVNYKGASLSWTRGNMLGSGTIKTGKSFTYKYGADNLRYSKTVNGTETLYYWDDGVLMGEKTSGVYTQYIYDASGIAGMIYNGTYYYFDKNLFGDVLRAYDSNGTTVAAFRYDSYGNVISATGSMADKVNFRYRGYYYDNETDFYYLQSRYYSPEIGRFISADQHELLPALSDSLGELNLYSYCSNNPIMYTDETGTWIIFSIIMAVFTVAGGVIGYAVGSKNGDEGWALVGDVAIGLIAGAAAGGAFIAGTTAIVGGGAAILGKTITTIYGLKTIQAFTLGAAIMDSMVLILGAVKNNRDLPLIEWGTGNDNQPTVEPPPAIITPLAAYYYRRDRA